MMDIVPELTEKFRVPIRTKMRKKCKWSLQDDWMCCCAAAAVVSAVVFRRKNTRTRRLTTAGIEVAPHDHQLLLIV